MFLTVERKNEQKKFCLLTSSNTPLSSANAIANIPNGFAHFFNTACFRLFFFSLPVRQKVTSLIVFMPVCILLVSVSIFFLSLSLSISGAYFWRSLVKLSDIFTSFEQTWIFWGQVIGSIVIRLQIHTRSNAKSTLVSALSCNSVPLVNSP